MASKDVENRSSLAPLAMDSKNQESRDFHNVWTDLFAFTTNAADLPVCMTYSWTLVKIKLKVAIFKFL